MFYTIIDRSLYAPLKLYLPYSTVIVYNDFRLPLPYATRDPCVIWQVLCQHDAN